MADRPLISVIVPVYKVEAFLPKCVDSIRGQTYDDLEIILVDDGSPDGCGAMCDAFAAEDPRIKVIHKPNGGLSDARNAGIGIASGEYLGFVDSDDWIEPEMYESLMEMALREDLKLVCGGRYDVYEGAGRDVGLCPDKTEVISGEDLAKRIFVWDGIDSAAWDKLYHRSLFREIRYPVGKICEDLPTTYRIGLDAGRVGMVAKPFYNYFHRAGSITTAKMSDARLHVLEHTAFILEDVEKNCPTLLDHARYFRIRQVADLLQMIEITDSSVRKNYLGTAALLRKELRRELATVMGSGVFTRRKQAEIALMLSRVYRPLRTFYHKLGRRA